MILNLFVSNRCSNCSIVDLKLPIANTIGRGINLQQDSFMCNSMRSKTDDNKHVVSRYNRTRYQWKKMKGSNEYDNISNSGSNNAYCYQKQIQPSKKQNEQ